jgi:hypothetical protein
VILFVVYRKALFVVKFICCDCPYFNLFFFFSLGKTIYELVQKFSQDPPVLLPAGAASQASVN